MNVIPITPATLDIIEVLNDGVRPALETKETFFVYRGADAHSNIITISELNELPEYMTLVKIFYIGR